MKMNNIPVGSQVFVTLTKTIPAEIKLEGEEDSVKKILRKEVVSHVCRVVKIRYSTLTDITEGTDEEDVLFDGFTYQCDDGSTYSPGAKLQYGTEVELRLATQEEIDIFVMK